MFIRKKMQVQKTFRIDENIEKDLGILAKMTERSQNELANVALSEMLQDNKMYFLKTCIVEHLDYELNVGHEPIDEFELGGLKVEFLYAAEEFKVCCTIKNERFEKVFKSDYGEALEKYLMDLTRYIDQLAPDVEKYLEERTDYQDYVKVRNE